MGRFFSEQEINAAIERKRDDERTAAQATRDLEQRKAQALAADLVLRREVIDEFVDLAIKRGLKEEVFTTQVRRKGLFGTRLRTLNVGKGWRIRTHTDEYCSESNLNITTTVWFVTADRRLMSWSGYRVSELVQPAGGVTVGATELQRLMRLALEGSPEAVVTQS